MYRKGTIPSSRVAWLFLQETIRFSYFSVAELLRIKLVALEELPSVQWVVESWVERLHKTWQLLEIL